MKYYRILMVMAIPMLLFATSCHNKQAKVKTVAAVDTLLSPSVYLAHVGDMELYALQDNVSSMRKATFPDLSDSLAAVLIPDGAAPSSVTIFLLKRQGKNILFDTGVGRQLQANLNVAGITPQDVDAVVISHFHGDHIGGLMQEGAAAFPNATLCVPKAEVDAVAQKLQFAESADGINAMLAAYQDRTIFVEPETVFYEGITAHDATGHTIGHTVYEVDGFLFGGDLLHAQAIQFAHPEICAGFDFNKAQAILTRTKFFNYTAANTLVFASTHLPFPSIIRDIDTVWEGK